MSNLIDAEASSGCFATNESVWFILRGTSSNPERGKSMCGKCVTSSNDEVDVCFKVERCFSESGGLTKSFFESNSGK